MELSISFLNKRYPELIGASATAEDQVFVTVGLVVAWQSVIDDDIHVLEGVGKVMRVVTAEESDAPGMGLVFLNLTPESEQVLNELVAKRGED